jgi:hypothetical protein
VECGVIRRFVSCGKSERRRGITAHSKNERIDGPMSSAPKAHNSKTIAQRPIARVAD